MVMMEQMVFVKFAPEYGHDGANGVCQIYFCVLPGLPFQAHSQIIWSWWSKWCLSNLLLNMVMMEQMVFVKFAPAFSQACPLKVEKSAHMSSPSVSHQSAFLLPQKSHTSHIHPQTFPTIFFYFLLLPTIPTTSYFHISPLFYSSHTSSPHIS